MRTENLRINELSDDAYSWYIEYLTALDAKDVELVQNNMDPVAGRDAVHAGLSEYRQSFGELEHDLLNIYGSDRNFVLEALNHYSKLDGEPVTLRAVAFTDRNDQGLASSVRFFTDTAPLFG